MQSNVAPTWPDVGILIPTYNRVNILIRTVELLEQNLRYSGVKHYYIGNDGDEEVVFPIIDSRLANIDGLMTRMKILVGPRRRYKASNKKTGLGANLNMLLEESAKESDDFLFQMDDDHHLVELLNLDPHVMRLKHADAGWIRLMGIAEHHYTATLEGDYWHVHWDSEGPYSLYIPSNRPHLKHRRFHDFYGMYPEGKKLGETEEAFCHQCRNRWKQWKRELETGAVSHRDEYGAPSVLVPLNSNSETAWRHVGDSWQRYGE